MYDAVDQLSLAPLEFVIDDFPLGVSHFLNNILLSRLRGDAAKRAGVQFTEKLIADLSVRVEIVSCLLQADLERRVIDLLDNGLGFEKLDLTKIGIILRLDLALVAKHLLGRRHHGVFQGADQNGFVDALFFTDLLYDSIQILLHFRRSSRVRNSPSRWP